MRLGPWRRWALVLGALVAMLSPTAGVRADGSAEPPGENERVVKLGPQAVVIMDERGQARMYDDPSEQVRVCKTNAGCLARALGVIAMFSTIATYQDVAWDAYRGGQAVGPIVGAPP